MSGRRSALFSGGERVSSEAKLESALSLLCNEQASRNKNIISSYRYLYIDNCWYMLYLVFDMSTALWDSHIFSLYYILFLFIDIVCVFSRKHCSGAWMDTMCAEFILASRNGSQLLCPGRREIQRLAALFAVTPLPGDVKGHEKAVAP